MTPQERQSVDELFDRLAGLENTPRDADAERAIADGLRSAPHAVYALVQTVLVQNEALKRADARIRELSGEADAPRESGSFLDTMRSALLGGSNTATSVPTVHPGTSGPDPRWNSGGAMNAAQAPQQQAPQQQAPSSFGGGGSFLGTAAASAAGAIGGAMLFNSIGSMFGHHGGALGGGSAFAGDATKSTDSPWSGVPSDNDLSRVANDPGNDRAGLVDASDTDDTDVADSGDDADADFGGDDSGNDTA